MATRVCAFWFQKNIQYDQLSVVQWVAGFCRTLREEQNPQVKEHMLDYLIALMKDANDFSWDAAQGSHAVLLCRMEQGEVKNYTETEKLDRIILKDMWPILLRKFQIFQKKAKSKVHTCSYYNQGTCMHQKSHDTKSVLTVSNNLAKLTHIQNKIAGIRPRN